MPKPAHSLGNAVRSRVGGGSTAPERRKTGRGKAAPRKESGWGNSPRAADCLPYPNEGVYVLRVRLTQPAWVRVGALGRFHMAPGEYLYVGSARRNLRQRVRRHLSPGKTVRWHIDHLTTAPGASPQRALLFPGGELSECALNRAVGSLPGASAPVPRFGAGDCRAGCPAHLWHTASPLAPEHLARLLGGGVVLIHGTGPEGGLG